jgi:hypothetical protein
LPKCEASALKFQGTSFKELRQTRRPKTVLQQDQILKPNRLENVCVKQKKARNESCQVYGNHSVFAVLDRDWPKQSSLDIHWRHILYFNHTRQSSELPISPNCVFDRWHRLDGLSRHTMRHEAHETGDS